MKFATILPPPPSSFVQFVKNCDACNSSVVNLGGKAKVMIFRHINLPTDTQQRTRKNAMLMLLFMIESFEFLTAGIGFTLIFGLSSSSPEKRGQLTGLFEAVPMTQYDEVEV